MGGFQQRRPQLHGRSNLRKLSQHRSRLAPLVLIDATRSLPMVSSRSFSASKVRRWSTGRSGNGTHIAFSAGHRTVSDSCHKSGLAGGIDDGALASGSAISTTTRFLRDPDGNKIEIVTFAAD